jgi:hypothetical protein
MMLLGVLLLEVHVCVDEFGVVLTKQHQCNKSSTKNNKEKKRGEIKNIQGVKKCAKKTSSRTPARMSSYSVWKSPL